MNVQEERNFFLRARLRSDGVLSADAAAQLEVPWRTNGLASQIAFFILGCVAVGAFYGMLNVLDVDGDGLIAGIAAIVVAEYLIGSRRWFFTGVEAALWFCGVFALISELPSSGRPEANLVLAAGAAIAGARVRNPLFGALAAYFITLYFEKRFDLGTLCALAISLSAAIALLRTWRRPTTEWLWVALVLAMPLAGYDHADSSWRDITIVLYATAGVIALSLAIVKRHHALFLSAIILFAIAGAELAEKITAPDEAKLAVAGTVLLAIAFAISRALRDRTRGLVLTPIQLTPFDDAAEIAATLAHQPSAHAPEPHPQAAPASGGGSFGGAGASGDY